MKKLTYCMNWFYMLGKRLMKQWSFVVLLCLIPVIIPIGNMAMQQDSGLMRVTLCHEGDDITAKAIITSLMEKDSMVYFTVANSEEEANELVANHKTDVAWIFPEDFSHRLDQYAANKSRKPVVTVVRRESNMANQIVNELLFSAMFRDFSYDIYRNFSEEQIVNGKHVSDQTIKDFYLKLPQQQEVVTVEKVGADQSQSQVNYLNAPIRGLLAIMVLLCTLTAAMYAVKDRSEGRFDWLAPQKRIIPAIGSCLAAAILSAGVMLVSLALSNLTESITNELVATLLLAVTATGFSLLVSLPFSSYGKFGAMIPGILILSLVLSPIFFNFVELEKYFRLLPIYYYLNGVYGAKYHLLALGYMGVIYTLVFVGNLLLSKQTKRNIMI